MENTIIKKPSAMIQINAKGLSTMQRKIINSLIYLAQKDSFGNIFYKTTLAVIKQLCNIKTTDNQEIKNKLEELSNITIKFNYLNKDYDHIWSAISILAEVHINFGNGEVKFAFPPTINEHIVKPKIYSPLNLVLVAGLTSNYSIALYELFRDYIDSYSFPKLSIEQLRDLLGIEENLYPRFQDFKKRALNVAIHEINTKTDISCSYELIKESGNRYSHIKFTIQKKKSEFLKKFDMALSCLEQVNPSESFEMIQEKIAKDFKISKKILTDCIKNYGLDRVKEVYEFLKSNPVKNPAGFFISALKEEYELNLQNIYKKNQKDSLEYIQNHAKICFNSIGSSLCKQEWDRIKSQGENLHCFWCEKFKIQRYIESNSE